MTTTRAGIVLRHIRGLAARPAGADDDRRLLERLTASRDEAAFAELVRRHGPLVLGVCRRVLRDAHDAEDAFQATFLVLARKAASISKRASVGGWLYQVAYHAALKARADAAARRRREQRAGRRPPADPLDELSGRELLAVLDEELSRLPERERAPLVLCYLEGRTRDEAARELGCPLGTLKRRLEAGRGRLRERLSRRGLALPAALLAAGVAGPAVPAALAAETARAAAGGAAPAVTALAGEVMRALTAGKVKAAAALLLAAGVVAGASLLALRAPAAAEEPKAAAAVAAPGEPAAPAADEKKETTFGGQVLDPDGKPAARARVYLLHPRPEDGSPPKVRAVTDKDGRFRFTAPPDAAQLFVTAAGFAPAGVLTPGKLEDNPLRLARDDVPVTGRVLDLQGQPVAGAVVRVHALKASPAGSLDRWLDAVKVRRDGTPAEYEHLPWLAAGESLAPFFPPVTTGKDGRFRIDGVGRERAVALLIEAPAIETREVNVLTRPGVASVRVPRYGAFPGDELLVYHPPAFDHVAAPCRAVAGVVRDKATGKPVGGAEVRFINPVANPVSFVRTTTDKEGRYRLTGLPRKPLPLQEDAVVVLPPDGEPYLAVQTEVPEGKEGKAASLDFDLPRGVWLEGQVKDGATGRGVKARLGYFVFADGPDEPAAQGLYIPPMAGLCHMTDGEGKFRIVAAPHRGILAARATGEARERYRVGIGADKIEGGTKDEGGAILFRALPHTANAEDFDALAEVKPEKGAAKVRCDLVLDPGRSLAVQVRGPDGKPLEGVQAFGQFARAWWEPDPLPAEFPVRGLAPGEGRTLMLRHPGKNLAARFEVKADERGPVVVALRPAGSVVGRLIDDEGRPLRHAEIAVTFRPEKDGPLHLDSRDLRSDADGKFRVEGLLPGVPYSADVRPADERYAGQLFEGLSLKEGERKDLGDVKPKRDEE
jgi:RNA polymerase sigma factor (sigma-70 family)